MERKLKLKLKRKLKNKFCHNEETEKQSSDNECKNNIHMFIMMVHSDLDNWVLSGFRGSALL